MRVGVVGLGSIGQRHLHTLSALPGVNVVAAADTRLGAPAGPDAGVAAAFTSLEEMVASVELDAVVLCTPSFLHAEQGILAANNGLHVITEKPMAIRLDDADELLDACARHGVQCAVLHQYRFRASVKELKTRLDSGRLGDLVFLDVAFNWRRSAEYYSAHGGWRGTWEGDGGGALINQGSHAVDLVRWLGGELASVMAFTTNVQHEIEAEDTVCVAIDFEGGGLGTVKVTTCADHNQPVTVHVVGTEAAASIVGEKLLFGEEVVVDAPAGGFPPDYAHREQFREIFSALAAGVAAPVSGADARSTLAATLAMYEAARRGAAVELERNWI